MHDRRGRHSPPVARRRWIEAPLPNHLAAEIERKDADIAEVGIDTLAVCGGCFACVAVLQMAGKCRDRFEDVALPDDLARVEINRENNPAMFVRGNASFAAEIESLFRLFDRL